MSAQAVVHYYNEMSLEELQDRLDEEYSAGWRLVSHNMRWPADYAAEKFDHLIILEKNDQDSDVKPFKGLKK